LRHVFTLTAHMPLDLKRATFSNPSLWLLVACDLGSCLSAFSWTLFAIWEQDWSRRR
jgi:hypothetical protein